MNPTDITIEILRAIQSTLVHIDQRLGEHGELLRSHGEQLASLRGDVQVLQRHAVATHETLKLMSERMSFFERVATVAMESRSHLADEVDDLKRRVEALEQRQSQ